jgi:hypothetical protein
MARKIQSVLLEANMAAGNAYIDRCYQLRTHRQNERGFIRKTYRECFGDYPETMTIGSAHYRNFFWHCLNVEGPKVAVSETWMQGARQSLQSEAEYTGSDPSLKVWNTMFDQTKEETNMAKKVNAETTAAETTEKNPFGKRIDCLGHPVTAVLRWMGKAGITSGQAKQIMEKLEIPVSPITCQIQVTAGAKGQRGNPAELTKAEEQQINALLKGLPERAPVGTLKGGAVEKPAPTPKKVADPVAKAQPIKVSKVTK